MNENTDLNSPIPLEYFLLKLKSNNPQARRIAVEGIGQLGDRRGVEPLMAALRDENVGVRYAAAQSLGMLGDKRALNVLRQAQKDEGETFGGEKVKVAATLALEIITYNHNEGEER